MGGKLDVTNCDSLFNKKRKFLELIQQNFKILYLSDLFPVLIWKNGNKSLILFRNCKIFV